MFKWIFTAVVCFSVFTACGDNRIGNLPLDAHSRSDNPELNLSAEGTVGLVGRHNVLSVTFDSDPSTEHDYCVRLTGELVNVSGTTNGDPWVQRLKLADSYLDFASKDQFVFYYKIVGSDESSEDVANLSEKFQSGTYKLSGDTIGFTVKNEGGLADAAEADYLVIVEDDRIILRSTKPLPAGNRFLQIEID